MQILYAIVEISLWPKVDNLRLIVYNGAHQEVSTMHCLNCGSNQFIIELDEPNKPFIGSLCSFTAKPPYTLIVACYFCGESFLNFPDESIQASYEAYVHHHTKRTPTR